MNTATDPNTAKTAAKLRVGFVLQPQFTLLALSGMVEILRVAADEGGRSRQIHCRWNTMTPGAAAVSSSCGLVVQPDSDLLPPDHFDYVVIVGALPEAQKSAPPAIDDYIRQAARQGVTLVGACTGSFLLARAGVMDGYRCCVHHYHEDAFEAEFPHIQPVTDQLYVIDRDRITCPGGTSPLDLAAHLVERHLGEHSAVKVNELFMFNEARKGSAPQTQFVTQWASAINSPLVQRAILIMQQRMSQPRTIANIAAELDVSSRKLERHFKAHLAMLPKEFYLRLRLDRSLWQLEHSQHALAVIASQCGFADASHFSQTFKKYFQLTPQAARQQLLRGGEKIENLVYAENLQSELLTEAVEGVTT